MLLIQPRKRSRATFDKDHAICHPASWQESAQNTSLKSQAQLSDEAISNKSTTRANSTTLSKADVAGLTLEQLQELSILISDRIQIKKRYNNTPLRRIIIRQASRSASQTVPRTDSDTASQTDTLVPETPETIRETPETRRKRYNNTPLRRILSRQASPEQPTTNNPLSASHALHEPEPPAVLKARYSNTPLRRIVSRQSPSPMLSPEPSSPPLSPSPLFSPQSPPRSSTPLRRILSRQVSAQSVLKTEDKGVERADSVIDPGSPVGLRGAAGAGFDDGEWGGDATRV